MIKEKELPKAVVNNKLITHKATDLTIMSYDKNVHKLIIPTDLTQDQISDIIVLITFRYHDNIIQISGDLVDDKIEIILPNEIRSLSGEFYIEIDINLTDNRQITFARYRANVVKSDIDSVDLDDAQEFYFELFDDFVQKVADKSEVAAAGIDAHKQSVSDKAHAAIAVITDASNSVTTAKQSALTSITQATSDVTDASTQFTADLADTQSTINAQVTQAQDSLQEVSDTLTTVNDKVTTVNDTADAFMADVADKSQLVDDKYQQFDSNVTEANQSLTEILAIKDNVDVMIKNEIQNGDFSQGLGEQTVSSKTRWIKVDSNQKISMFDGHLLIEFVDTESVTTSRYLTAWHPKISYKKGHVYYAYADIPKIVAGDSPNLDFVISARIPSVTIMARKSFKLNFNSVTFLTSGEGYEGYVGIGSAVSAQPFASTHSCTIKNFGVIDLTTIFGAGKEPTTYEMDELIAITGYFNDSIMLTQRQQLIWTLNLIRKNRMATTALGGTIL